MTRLPDDVRDELTSLYEHGRETLEAIHGNVHVYYRAGAAEATVALVGRGLRRLLLANIAEEKHEEEAASPPRVWNIPVYPDKRFSDAVMGRRWPSSERRPGIVSGRASDGLDSLRSAIHDAQKQRPTEADEIVKRAADRVRIRVNTISLLWDHRTAVAVAEDTYDAQGHREDDCG